SALPSGSAPSRILAVDPNTGVQRTISSGGNLSWVGGLIAFTKTSIANTTTTLSSSVNPSVFGQSVTFKATLSAGTGTPSGTVQFQIDGNNVGAPIAVQSAGGAITATFSTGTLTVGTHIITASYSGASNFAGSSGVLAGGEGVSPASAITSTVVTS